MPIDSKHYRTQRYPMATFPRPIIAGFARAFPERGHHGRAPVTRWTVEESDHRHRRPRRVHSGHATAPPSSVMNSRRFT